MAALKTFRKQPAETKDYDWNLDSFLDTPTTSGDFAVSAVVTIVSGNTGVGNLVLGPGTLQDFQIFAGKTSGLAGQRIKVWLGAGSNGVTYKITVLATLNSLRVEEKDFLLRVQEL